MRRLSLQSRLYRPCRVNGSDDIASLGGDLEVHVPKTRPGVRRRKGVPQSVRQQLKSGSQLVSVRVKGYEDRRQWTTTNGKRVKN